MNIRIPTDLLYKVFKGGIILGAVGALCYLIFR